MSRLLYLVSREVVRLFFLGTTHWEVLGKDNIPRTGQLLVVANHITFAEPMILRILLPREAKFATKEGFFRYKIIASLMRTYGCFPVFQGKADRPTMHKMEGYLAQGLAVVIFPEGTRSQKAELLPALKGTAMIAHRTGAPILPVGFSGTEKLKGKWWFMKRPVITVRFGHTFSIPQAAGRAGREESTTMIMERIAELLPPEYHGAYSKRKINENENTTS